MNLRNRLSIKPSMLMMIGMTCLVISSLPIFIQLATQLNPDAIDFARGLLIGLSIGFNLLAVLLYARNRRAAR
ncbi:MAG: hypothetical protein WB973_02005 [Thermoanaerobaculia bacterium]